MKDLGVLSMLGTMQDTFGVLSNLIFTAVL